MRVRPFRVLREEEVATPRTTFATRVLARMLRPGYADPLHEGSVSRARRETVDVVNNRGVAFGFVVSLVAPPIATLLAISSHHHATTLALAAVASAVAGFAAAVSLVLAAKGLRAPYCQRNEARAVLNETREQLARASEEAHTRAERLEHTAAQIADLEQQVVDLERQLPKKRRIEFGAPFRAEPRAFTRTTPQGVTAGQTLTPIVLPVHARGENVTSCRSTVEFRAEGFQNAMRGRWENHGEPKSIIGEDLSHLDRITLHKDEDEAIAIAVQHETDPHLYMLCNRSWLGFLHYGRDDLRDPEFTLPNSPVGVRVTVRGDDMEDCSFEFMLVQGERYQWRAVTEDEVGNPLVPFEEVGRDLTPGETDGEREAQLQKIRLIRGEIDTGRQIVERAIGVSQVYEIVEDDYWVGHRNELAAIPEAGAAHQLCVQAWDGFSRYNRAVNAREFISNDDLTSVAKAAMRANDALGVADDAVQKRKP